jgi:uncharacterized protein (TIGR01777 family)
MGIKLGVAITGASGLVGRGLVGALRERGHMVFPLSRGGGDNSWDVATGEIRTSGKVDVMVNLAGRNIATRWTAKAKKEIWESRVTATRKMCEFLAKMPADRQPGLLVSASATGIYGDRADEVLTEDSAIAPQGKMFLSDICRGWEAATKPAEEGGIRVIHVRLGVVLSREGGVMKKMRTPVKLGLAGPVGKGTQWMPWISRTDLERLLVRLVEGTQERGIINAVAGSVRQHTFMRTLGNILHRPTVFPMPGFLVKLVFGQMGREVLLGSQRVEAKRLPAGFVMQHPTLEGAIRAELGR